MIRFINYNKGTLTTAQTIYVPSVSCQAGDLILVHLACMTNFNVVAWPDGFSLVKAYNNSSPAFGHFLFAKIATSSEPSSYRFDLEAAHSIIYRVYIFRGEDQSQPLYNIYETNGTGQTISLSGINLQQGTMVLAIITRVKTTVLSSSDNWTNIAADYQISCWTQIFGGASTTENPVLFSDTSSDDSWSAWLFELKDAQPIIYDTIFVDWLLTDEPGSKLWVKINGEWKPAKVTII